MGASQMVKIGCILYPVFNENKINPPKIMKGHSQGTFSVLASFLFCVSSLPWGFWFCVSHVLRF